MKFTFSRGHYKYMQIGNDYFVFKYPVTCKQKNFKIHINFN